MKSTHITDEILQAYLLKEVKDDTIDKHLGVCSICQKKREEYQLLIESLQEIEAEIFSFDVTSLVMAKINEVETKKEKNTNIVLNLSVVFVSIVAIILLYPYFKIIFTLFKSLPLTGNVFILVSALGVVVFLLNDLFRKYKQKETLLS